MNLQDIFSDLADPERRQSGGRALFELVAAEATKVLRTTEDERDDAVQKTLVKLLEMVDNGQTDGIIGVAYLRSMLINGLRDQIRSNVKRREKEQDLVRVCPVEKTVSPATQSTESLERELRQRFELLVDTAVGRKSARYRDDTRRDLEQLISLAAGRQTMEELIAKHGVDPEQHDSARKLVVDRILQRHKRGREALEKAIELLLRQERVDADEAEELRRLCRLLLRCQKQPAKSVCGSGDEKI